MNSSCCGTPQETEASPWTTKQNQPATGHCRVSSSTPIRTAGYSQAAAEPMHRGCMCAACTLPSTSKHHHHQHRQHLSCCDVAKLQVYAWHTCLQCNKCSEQIGSSSSSSRCCPRSCFKQQVCPLSRARRGRAVLHAFSVLAALLAQEHQYLSRIEQTHHAGGDSSGGLITLSLIHI